jgi:hypothetical protein
VWPSRQEYYAFIEDKSINFPELAHYMTVILQMPNYTHFIYSRAKVYVAHFLMVACRTAVFRTARKVMYTFVKDSGTPTEGPKPDLKTLEQILEICLQHVLDATRFNKIDLHDIRRYFPDFDPMIDSCTLSTEMLLKIKPYSSACDVPREWVCGFFPSEALPPHTGETVFVIYDNMQAWREPQHRDADETFKQCILHLTEYLIDVLCGIPATNRHVFDVSGQRYSNQESLWRQLESALGRAQMQIPEQVAALPPNLDAASMLFHMIRKPPTMSEERNYYHKLKEMLGRPPGEDSDDSEEERSFKNPMSVLTSTPLRFVGKL